ncbi:MAG TPA: branched-chain amino acid ABC transporter permease [Streptosporangiaceae bacterium]|nr:branched-chain amino acid ABC transporter permease [Streptosporangiaceae bacterium]
MLLRRARPVAAARAGATSQKAATLVVLAVALVFPLFEGANVSVMGIAIEVLTYGLVTLALNLLMGYGGQVSIGHGGLLAVGAYTTAIVATRFRLPFIVVLVLAGVVTAVVGLLLGLPAGRLRSHYLAVATLGFGVAVPQIALNLGSLTGGFTGLIVPTPYIGTIALNEPVPLYYVALGILALSVVAIRSILASPTGRRFMAVRDSEDTAPAMGINVGRTKVVIFTVSSFFCGLAGYVFALNNGIVEPDSFTFSLSLFFFAAVIVGGLASIWGSLIGAALLVVVQQESVSLGGFSEAILGAAVVVMLLLAPGGLAALPRRLRGLVAGAWRPHPEAVSAAGPLDQHRAPPSAGSPGEG